LSEGGAARGIMCRSCWGLGVIRLIGGVEWGEVRAGLAWGKGGVVRAVDGRRLGGEPIWWISSRRLPGSDTDDLRFRRLLGRPLMERLTTKG